MIKYACLLALVVLASASDVLEFNDDNFNDKVAENDIVLVEFYAPWWVNTSHTVSFTREIPQSPYYPWCFQSQCQSDNHLYRDPKMCPQDVWILKVYVEAGGTFKIAQF